MSPTSPGTRVYDAADELQTLGLVAATDTRPRRYAPVSTDAARRHFESKDQDRVAALADVLSTLEQPHGASD